MEDKNFWKGLAAGIIFSAVAVISGYMGYRSADTGEKVLDNRACREKISYLESLIDVRFYEEKDEEKLAEGLYKGLISGLGDPYSAYYTAAEYEQLTSSTEGSYVGVGIVIQKNPQGGVLVVECYEGGPAQLAGVKEGDIISAVNGTDVTQMETTDVVALIKGEDAPSAVLTVHRENVEEPLEITVEIKDVELPAVDYEMLDENTGYIRIYEFTGVAPGQYESAFEDLCARGMEYLVVDLRDNPGGLLNSVCDILRDILPEGLIVYTEDKYGERQEETCDGENPLNMPLVVLVNGQSASASEIFAGAVKDYGVGTIVGTTTFGKGIVQAIVPLDDGSAVKLTVSSYYTPKGVNIHEVGIQPDVEVPLDSTLLNKSREEITHEEDNQLQEALKVLKEIS